MDQVLVDAKEIKRIVDKTLATIEESRNEIYGIVENARAEVERIKVRLKEVQEATAKVIHEVDELEALDKVMRKKLVTVSKDFNHYSESDIKVAYEKASEIRVRYFTKQQEEKNLREKRAEMEHALKKAMEILMSAERLINQVGVAMNYLAGDMNSATGGEIGGEESVYLGIKVLEAQEEERRRLSRDIHDGPAQAIANIVLKAEICKTLMDKDIQKGLEELEKLKASVRNTLKDIRKIIYDLRPMSIDDLGLIPTIRRFAHEFSNETNIEVDVETTKITEGVEKIIQIAVFRLVQEVFNNIRKHAQATKTILRLQFGSKYLSIEIEDNGVGFDFEESYKQARLKQESFGLVGIVERVNQLHGEIHYESGAGNGTKVYVEIPVNRGVMMDEFQSHKDTSSG